MRRLRHISVRNLHPFFGPKNRIGRIHWYPLVRESTIESFSFGAMSQLSISSDGCLYQKKDDGLYLIERVFPEKANVEVLCGAKAISFGAFRNNTCIEKNVLPEGLSSIGDGSFQGCSNLQIVEVLESLKLIENDAFKDSRLKDVCISVNVVEIGEMVFVSTKDRLKIKKIVVSPDNNPYFYETAGLLCQRREGKGGYCDCLWLKRE